MIIDCDGCAARPAACGDCVVGVLLDARPVDGERDREGHVPPGAPVLSLDAPERRALHVLAEQGLVPRLRLVATTTRRVPLKEHPGEPRRDAG